MLFVSLPIGLHKDVDCESRGVRAPVLLFIMYIQIRRLRTPKSPAAIWHRWINAVFLSLVIVWWRDRRCLQNKIKRGGGGGGLMNLTDDYSQGAVIACQMLIGFDWMWGEIDLTPPRILCARTEQQLHLQSRHRKGSGLYGDGLHEQGRLGCFAGKSQCYYRQVWFACFGCTKSKQGLSNSSIRSPFGRALRCESCLLIFLRKIQMGLRQVVSRESLKLLLHGY